MNSLSSLFIFLLFLQLCVAQLYFPILHIPPRVPNEAKRATGEAIALQGSIATNGQFYASISLGTPPQSFLVSVDTGSTDLLIYGNGCSGCASSPVFTLGSTSTIYPCSGSGLYCSSCITVNSQSSCKFTDTYGDGSSVSGYVISDMFSIGDYTPVRADFGVITTSNTANFEPPPSSGIWGLAYSVLSSWAGVGAIDKLIAGQSLTNVFSMCTLENAGVMSIGEDFSSNPSFVWTNILRQTYYPISIDDVKLNSNSLGVSSSVYNANPGAIVDSGTTLMYLPPTAWTAFKNAIIALNLHGIADAASGRTMFDGYCYTFTSAQLSQWPTINIQVTGISAPLAVPSSAYLVKIGSYYCLGVDTTSIMILGDVFMRNFHVVFDRQHGKLGFGPISTCPGVGTVSTTQQQSVSTTAAQTTRLQTTAVRTTAVQSRTRTTAKVHHQH